MDVDLWNSLTTVGKTASCPGECLHAITSIFCDNVIEEISCGEANLRCCVSQQMSYAETSLPPITITEPTLETFSVISNNHNNTINKQFITEPSDTISSTNNVWTLEQTTTNNIINVFMATTTTTIGIIFEFVFIIILTNHNFLLIAPVTNSLHYIGTDPPLEAGRDSYTTCPVRCSKLSPNTFCVKPMHNTICADSDEECCLETESAFDTMTKNLIKLVQKTVELNETKNLGSDLVTSLSLPNTNTPSTTPQSPPTSTTPSLPPCDGTCVVSLFSILCDEIDSTQYCPNSGSCCVNRELTTQAPTISACEGTCIPVILSGMCNKPYELVLKTLDCASGTICCADKKSDSDISDSLPSDDTFVNNNNPENDDGGNSGDKISISQPSYVSRPVMRPPPPPPPPLQPPAQMIPPGLVNANFNYKPNPYLVNSNSNPVPIPPMHPIYPKPFVNRNKQTITDSSSTPQFHHVPNQGSIHQSVEQPPFKKLDSGSSNIIFPETIDTKPIEDMKPVIISQSGNKFSCPGNCMTHVFRFACFGANSLYPAFQCSKNQVCCASNAEIEKFEAFIQSQSQMTSTKPSVNINKVVNTNNGINIQSSVPIQPPSSQPQPQPPPPLIYSEPTMIESIHQGKTEYLM